MANADRDPSDRRDFLKIAAGGAAAIVAGVGPSIVSEARAQGAEQTAAATAAEPADNRYTRRMAEFVSQLRYEDLPADVIDRIKLLTLDTLGCALFAVDLEWSRILMRTLRAVDGTSSCSVWGTSQKLSAPHATLVNGTLVQGFELDDTHRLGPLHPGSVTLPPLVAIAEMKPGLSGRDFLTAAVAGYETGPRVGICMGQEHLVQGWHPAGTLGVFSAAATSARALRLNASQTVHAIGIAGTQASGLMAAQYGSMVKRMHVGRSAQSGLYGALLAADGFTGITNVFESDYGGFCTTLSRSHDRFKLDELTAGLGQRFETMQVSLKFYSCVSSNHTTLDAIRAMRTKRPFTARDVDRVVVHGSEATVEHVGWKYRPDGITAAQLNLPFCVATLLLAGDVFVDQFDDKQIADPARIALADKVSVVEDKTITARGARFRQMVRVEVFLNDKTVLTDTVEAPRGSEQRFASRSDIVEKFEKLAGHVVAPAQVGSIRDAVLELERLPDVARLTQLLAKTA